MSEVRPTTDEAGRRPPRNLATRAARGIRWNLLGVVGTNLLRLGTIPILGRVLTPGEFGVVAAALTVITFATFLKDAGVGNALVQRKDLDEGHVEAAFLFSSLFGVCLTGILIALAPLIASLYGERSLTQMVQMLSLMFLLRGAGTVPQALLRREMRFRDLAVIDFASYALGSVVTVVLAVIGYGAWAIVVGYLAESTASSLALFIRRPVRYTRSPDVAKLKVLAGYGTGHLLGEIANYAAYQGDNIAVGAHLGTAALGLYTRAYDLMRYPAVAFSNIAGSVLFSAFSKIQDAPERLAHMYQRSLFAVSVVLLPTSAALVVLAPEFIELLLGPRWGVAVLPFQILAASMLPRTTFKLGVTIARAAGDVFAVAFANTLYGAMVVVGALVCVRWGLAAVAVSTGISVYVNFFLLSYLGLRRTTLTWGGFFGAHTQPILAMLATVALLWPAAHLLRQTGSSGIVVLVGASLAGLSGAGLALLLGVRRRHRDWCWLYGGVLARVRRRARRQVS